MESGTDQVDAIPAFEQFALEAALDQTLRPAKYSCVVAWLLFVAWILYSSVMSQERRSWW
jgi:hypothetical protein